MDSPQDACLLPAFPITAQNAGLFFSRGIGRHPERVIDSFEIIFVRQGELGMWEEDGIYALTPGQALLLHPGRRHGGAVDYPRDLRFYWIHFTCNDACAAGLEQIGQVVVPRPDTLTEHFRRYLDDQESGQLTPLVANLLVALMLAEVTRPTQNANQGNSMGIELAQRAAAYIQAHFVQPISTSRIAAALDCNADYLGRVFAEAFRMTPTQAIHRRRVRQACSLLIESTMAVEEIAHACGFDDVGYFRRIFRRVMGLSPRAYRRQYARVHVNSV